MHRVGPHLRLLTAKQNLVSDNNSQPPLTLTERRRLLPPTRVEQRSGEPVIPGGTLLDDLQRHLAPALIRHCTRFHLWPGNEQSALEEIGLMESFLIKEVVSMSVQLFALEINVARVCGRLTAQTPELRYSEWLTYALTDDYLAYILRKYEVLALRLSALIHGARQLVQAIQKAAQADALALKTCFGIETPRAIRFLVPAGDSHHQGKRATIVEFQEGARVLYKPRSDAPEQSFAALLSQLPDDVRDKVQVPRTLSGDNYHWQEWVEREDRLPTYEAAGLWLAVAHLSSTRDLHHENLIPRAGALVAVDLECAYNALPELAPDGNPRSTDWDLLSGSSILPVRVGGSEISAGANWGVIGAVARDLSGMPFWRIENDGSDEVRIRRAFRDATDERQSAVDAHLMNEGANLVASAFERGVTAVQDLIERIGLHGLADLSGPTRILLRSTQTYADVIARNQHPAAMLSIPEHARLLTAALREVSSTPLLEAVIDSEVAELQLGDIPLYYAEPGSTHLEVGDTQVPLIGAPAIMRRRAEAMRLAAEGRDTRLEQDTIRKQIAAFLMLPSQQLPEDAREASRNIQDLAESLFDSISMRPGPVWVNVNRASDNRWVIGPGGPNLYQGTAGMLVALSAANRRGIAVPQRLLTDLIDDVAVSVHDSRLGIGAFSGLAGIPFSLAAAHADGNIDARTVQVLADTVAEKLLGADQDQQSWDVISGWSGVALVYSELVRVGLVDTALGLAVLKRALDILEERDATPADPHGHWLDPACDDWLGGLSHGAAGVAAAAARLSHYVPDRSRATHLSERAWNTQMSLSDPNSGFVGWVDRRPARLAGDGSMQAWCHGTEGIAIAAQEVAQVLGEAFSNVAAIEAAVGALPFTPTNPSLCHGSSGRLIALARTADVDSSKGASIRSAVRDEVRRDVGDVRLLGRRAPESWNEGLMVGRAGILWALLAEDHLDELSDPLSLRLGLPTRWVPLAPAP